ncbi:hypothetical protein ACFYT3_22685 [Nocardia amikacinitolerans]|uniref:hypothetical protein n=1 Tax=Nocardia amikacinitolerans TaxID=756689 RepID=UPI0020A5B3A9|nr:hypothetical protein [Nocardia amikacinitolerans]MCP2291800.1 hypothetical protein [Nocardia amikacinitolerans]
MFGLPSFDTIVLNMGKLALNGPLGAVVSGANDMNQSASAIATALGDQSPESIAARNRIKDLTDNHFEGEFHNSRIPASLFGNVRAEDLDELYRKAQAIDVNVMTTLQQMWKSRAEKLDTGLAQFGPEILSAIRESWHGASADAAAQGIVDYVNKAQNLVSATKIVADKVEVVKSAVEVTKANVQPSPDTGWASTVASWIPGPTWKMDRNRTDAAELATYTVLEQVYEPGIREGDAGQPRIPLAYNPVQEPGSVPVSPPPGSRPPTSEPRPLPGPGGTDDPGTDDPGTDDPGGANPQKADLTAAQPDPASEPTQPSGLDTTPSNATTTPAGANPAANIPATPSTPGLGSPGSPGYPGAPGGSSPGSPGGSIPGTPGSSIPGTPGGTTPGYGSRAGGTGAAARGGIPGMGGMAPAAARGKGDDDKEKGKSAIAEALVTLENGEELTGMDPAHRPKTVPPVLGE